MEIGQSFQIIIPLFQSLKPSETGFLDMNRAISSSQMRGHLLICQGMQLADSLKNDTRFFNQLQTRPSLNHRV
ncbi:MAG: hypothetical protein DRI57_23760, partial [Deltaproteobacteria bacterium]